MKPVVVITVHRRYFELNHALRRVRELAHEFTEKPEVVVVWACPETARLWFFQDMLKEGYIDRLITRMPLEGEGREGGTTYPESHSIRMGLEYVASLYGQEEAYVILQTGDLQVKEKTGYAYFDKLMNQGSKAVVLYWENGCVHDHIWHTNFFAVCLDSRYWPPVSLPSNQDVLERQWGKCLQEARLPGIETSHNYNEKRFIHAHLSEGLPSWPVKWQDGSRGVGLAIVGYKRWCVRAWEFFRRCIRL